ncbi:MAG: sel1 repeat family protein, partial [Gammaproteobacteria bacterium]|nr:sel1 repeat family protein [Gammaproteobacteria bacterium]
MPSPLRPVDPTGVPGGRTARDRRGVLARLAGGALVLAAAIAAAAPKLTDGLQAYQQGDYIKALDIWVQLAGRGDPVAQFGLGMLHQGGKGVERDEARAAEWFRKAAEQGFVPAQFNLGNAYQQ